MFEGLIKAANIILCVCAVAAVQLGTLSEAYPLHITYCVCACWWYGCRSGGHHQRGVPAPHLILCVCVCVCVCVCAVAAVQVGTISEAYPHLIFDQFSSKLGERCKSVLQHLFPVPKEASKRVVTLANRDDYISFRHHTYAMARGAKSVELTEVGGCRGGLVGGHHAYTMAQGAMLGWVGGWAGSWLVGWLVGWLVEAPAARSVELPVVGSSWSSVSVGGWVGGGTGGQEHGARRGW